VLFLTAFAVTACSKDGDRSEPSTTSESAPASTAATDASGLTSFQLQNGIGPLTAAVTIDARVNHELAEKGEELFEQKCASCHKLSDRYVGPPLADVMKRRTPTFTMNMMLNPLGMVERHPETKKLLAEFFVAMPNQNLTPEEARQVFEYLRSEIH
jgi:mono/diheme cytochrome c family protein